MAGSQHGNPPGFLLYSRQCHLPRGLHARLDRAGRLAHFLSHPVADLLPWELNKRVRVRHGCTIALLLGYGCESLGKSGFWDGRADSVCGARYSTMDNIDGKQARRTGQSSGLGELFEYVLTTEWPTSPPLIELQPRNRLSKLHASEFV